MAHDAGGKWSGYGLGDVGSEVARVQHRLLYAYPKNSFAVQMGVLETGVFDDATRRSVQQLAIHINSDPALLRKMTGGDKPLRTDGIADLALRTAIRAYIPPVLGPKYRIQGVWHDTRAYLMPPDAPSFNRDTAAGAREGQRLTQTIDGDIIGIGYSMGAKTLRDYEMTLTAEQRARYLMSINFGDPSMRPDGSLLGNDPGEGISRQPHPDFVADRYWSYSIDGDWYPRARGLLFFFYEVISRAELTLDFASWLLTKMPTVAMQELTGLVGSSDDTGVAGILSGLVGFVTAGPVNFVPANPLGNLVNPLQLLALLPSLINLMVDAVKFVGTQAHGMYADLNHAFWDGMTAVDHAVKTIRETCPNGATLLLFPGSWAMWNQGFQFDVALRLQ